jgi:hypothetical protein
MIFDVNRPVLTRLILLADLVQGPEVVGFGQAGMWPKSKKQMVRKTVAHGLRRGARSATSGSPSSKVEHRHID